MTEKRRTGSNPLDSLLKQIPDYVGEGNRDKQSKTKSETFVEPETISETKPESKTITQSETVAQPKTKSKTQSKSKAKSQPQTFSQTFASDMKIRAAESDTKPRFEEAQKRQTYWLDGDTIERIAELAEKAKCNKYQVVSAGVQMLYEYVFAEQEDGNE